MNVRSRLQALLWITVIVGLLPLTAQAQEEVTLIPSKDNTLYESDDGSSSNGAGQHLFVGMTNQDEIRRMLLAFDVASAVPEGATVDSVKLTLHMSKTIAGAHPAELRRVLADWGEGASDAPGQEGSGANAATDDATWLHTFFDSETWQEPGGEFADEVSASQSVSDTGFYTWGSTPEMVADVQAWLDDPSSNFGWIVIGDESTSPTAKRFDSREHSDESVRPTLTIYTSSTPTSIVGADVPERFELAAPYPSPVRSTATITYTLPSTQEVTLALYDVLGRAVTTLVDGVKPAGTHQVTVDARNLPNGVYLYRLSSSRFERARTLIVQK